MGENERRFYERARVFKPEVTPPERSAFSAELRSLAQENLRKSGDVTLDAYLKRQNARSAPVLRDKLSAPVPVSSPIPMSTPQSATSHALPPEGVTLPAAIAALRAQIEAAQKAAKGGEGFFVIEYADIELELVAEKSKTTAGSLDWVVGFSKSADHSSSARHKVTLRLQINKRGKGGGGTVSAALPSD